LNNMTCTKNKNITAFVFPSITCNGEFINAIDEIWIGIWIYWTLTDTWLQVIINILLIHTFYSSLEHTLKSSQPAVSSTVFW
jgi:hypothetical protein